MHEKPMDRTTRKSRCHSTSAATLLVAMGILASPLPLAAQDQEGPVTLESQWTVEIGGGGRESIAYSPDGKLIVAASSRSDSIAVLDATSGEVVKRLDGHKGGGVGVAVLPDGVHVISGGNDEALRKWSLSSGKQVAEGKARRAADAGWSMHSFAVDPDGKYLALGIYEAISFHRVSSFELAARIDGHDKSPGEPAGDGVVYLRGVMGLAFSRDGSKLASGGPDALAKVWDAKTRKVLKMLKGHEPGYVWGVAFSPNGKLLASSGEKTTRVWDTSTGAQRLELPTGSTRASTFDSSGGLLVTGGDDGFLRVWDVAKGKELTSARNGGTIASVILSPDGSRVAVNSSGAVSVWRLVARTATGDKGK